MASFFNVGGLGGNPFSTPVGQKIEQATDATLASENWAWNMEICDMINESSDTARDAMKAIRKRLSQNAGKNNQVIMYTLTVLETCVKNCGKAFHVLVAQKDFIQELVKLIGPKNDPPAALQEKVLSLIQIWADAFKNQPDLNGVTQMYTELKNKGIEFPQTDMEAMAPIYTPQRSVPEAPQPQMPPQQAISPQHGVVPVNNGPAALTPEQTAKLQSELEIVAHSMAILGEMLSELKPGLEEPEDYTLLTELTATCKEMQGRIVDLIGRINDDELTAELLRLNDELNNLFLRHQRYEKNRSSSGSNATSPSAILGAAIGVPQQNSGTPQNSGGYSTASAAAAAGAAAGAGAANSGDSAAISADAAAATRQNAEPLLIDLVEKSDKLSKSFQYMGINAPKTQHKDADEFDMLAQSRTDGGNNKSDLLRDIPSVDAAAGSLNSPFKTSANSEAVVVSKPTKENEVDEMEAWLGNTKDIEGIEETLTSTEFDKFLEERAAAAENLPTIAASNGGSSSGGGGSEPKKANKKSAAEADLLAL